MPFASEFDDVYSVIKTTVESAASDIKGRCFRLDESRPAGRITDRLLGELRSATLCVADLTETKPNVMWELGFAMALQKPTIIITQNMAALPFDIKDMQTIEYSRKHLSASLATPLKKSILDTLGARPTETPAPSNLDAATIGTLLAEMSQLRHIVAEAVNAWKPDESKMPQSQPELQSLVGHWFTKESRSHAYSRVVRGELVAAYCYAGNSELTGVYFGWRRTGEYWFARYQWLQSDLSGFSFLRMDSFERMTGAWWSLEDQEDQKIRNFDAPPKSSGVAATWIKQVGTATPSWAEDFFMEVSRKGLAAMLSK